MDGSGVHFITDCVIHITLTWLVGLWCLMPLPTIFQLYRAVSFIGGGVPRENHRPVASSLTNNLDMKFCAFLERKKI